MQMDKLKSLQKFTWDEVKVHNNPEDCWIVVEREVDGVKKGLILDVTEWAPNHPGGSIIYDGAGGDCTIMFWSYHPLSLIDNCASYINKMVVGEVVDYKCIYDVGTPFHRTLKQRVEQKIPASERRADWRMWLKTLVIVLTIAVSFYYGWIHGNMHAIILFGLAASSTGINMMHGGIHAAYSKSIFLCDLVAFSFNLAGANYLTYRRAHAFGHHAYTNHLEYDTGITDSFPVLRLHDRLERRWYHYFQYLYVVPIYLFSIILFWFGDSENMTTFYNFPKRPAPCSKSQLLAAVSGRVIFWSWFVGLHFYMFNWQRALLDCVIFGVELGFFGLMFFVVNHWTDKAVLLTNQELRNNTSDWAMLQILTSSNFAIKSWFWFHWSGGLNLQIEHHLFPGIIHTRLTDIQPIVRETCYEYGIRYDEQCYDTFWSALFCNFKFLKNLGRGISRSSFPALGRQKHA
jgi:fatty acid desaturase